MSQLAVPSVRQTNILRWSARIIGLLVVGIFLVFFIADWVEKGTFPVLPERIPMTFGLFVTFAGLLIAWRWDAVGGIVALLASPDS